MESIADKIGREAMEKAQEEPINLCLRFIARAVQRALGETEEQTGIDSAKDGAPFFLKRGFTKVVEDENYKNGDVVIMQASQKHQHGHIQTLYQGRWFSDFKQKGFYPFQPEYQPKFEVYRFKE